MAAWREQSGDDFGVMWWSLPASRRGEPLPRRIEALRERARAAGADVDAEERVDAEVVPTASDAGDLPAQVPVAKTSTEVAVSDNDGDVWDQDDEGGFDASWYVAWVLAVLFVVFAVIGFVTALGGRPGLNGNCGGRPRSRGGSDAVRQTPLP